MNKLYWLQVFLGWWFWLVVLVLTDKLPEFMFIEERSLEEFLTHGIKHLGCCIG